jgi:hypothetical protein
MYVKCPRLYAASCTAYFVIFSKYYFMTWPYLALPASPSPLSIPYSTPHLCQFIQYHWHVKTVLWHCGSTNHHDELMTRLSPCCDISYITWQVLCSVVFAFEVAGCLWCLADWVVLPTSSGYAGKILILFWYLKQHVPEVWDEFSFCQVYTSVSAGVWNSVFVLSPLGKLFV